MALLTPTTPSTALAGGTADMCGTSLKSFDLKHGFCLPDDATMDVCYSALGCGMDGGGKVEHALQLGTDCGQHTVHSTSYTPMSAPPVVGFVGSNAHSEFPPEPPIQFQQFPGHNTYKQMGGFPTTASKGSDDLFFKFDPEYIEKLQSTSSIMLSPAATVASTPLTCNSLLSCASSCTTATDYYNYNEANCQSKNQSPCSSPFAGDPWIDNGFSLNMLNLNGGSPKRNNAEFVTVTSGVDSMTPTSAPKSDCTSLPSIRSAFGGAIGGQFESSCAASQRAGIASTGQEPSMSYMMDFFDSSFLEQYSSTNKTDSSCCSNVAQDSYSYSSENYYKPTQGVEKPNREFKDIWKSGTSVTGPSTGHESPTLVAKQEPLDMMDELGEMEEPGLSNTPRSCLWSGCNVELADQQQLVAHIEKQHVEPKKGEVFGCQWLDCPRQHRPFNARYKLLIHMRVHSGEKPNKCPVGSKRASADAVRRAVGKHLVNME